MDEIKSFFEYKPEKNTNEHFAHEIFIFLYLSNGINMSDLLRLKYKNMSNEKLYFIREKTKNSRKSESKTVELILNERTKEIIKIWGNPNIELENYIFPQLEKAKNEAINEEL